MATQGTFFGLELRELLPLRQKYLDAIAAVAVAGQSYAIGGRSFTRAEISQLKDTLKEINIAIDRLRGNRVRRVLPNFSSSRSPSPRSLS